jgi:hypothetical protein
LKSLTLLISGAAAVALLIGAGAVANGTSTGAAAVSDIPDSYLRLYRAASDHFELGPSGWSVLAAIGKVECDHGRSPLVGCRRGEANAAGARGPAQFLAATWDAYGIDADGDSDRDVYEPGDAIFGMANYLRASGAPRDWRSAIYAYNHAGWYVEKVLQQAKAYRAATAVVREAPDGSWLAPVPGFTGERCDARIVPDVVHLVRTFGLHVSDCFGGAPHALNGEHPLGLAIDASPVDGDWRRTEMLARALGWHEGCAAAGCAGRGPLKQVLYNGFPGHGDPRHASTPHLHLSWDHAPAAPFSRAAWVRVLNGAGR